MTSKRTRIIVDSDEEEVGSISSPHSRRRHIISNSTAITLQRALNPWFHVAHDARSMPWRKRYDPALSAVQKAQRAYEVWVSEIMLQQTRVDTVIPYYNRWMQTFPTIKDLAGSNIEQVNALWKGLGYYSRAKRLLEGAQLVVDKFDGKLPDDATVLQASVPGIGRYSAGAICSIAYGKCVPVLDGNVHRLLSRVLALYANPKAKATTNLLWDAAQAIVDDAEDPGAINQALIELGSTVCTPREPKCAGCPINTHCNAYKWKLNKLSTDMEDLCNVCEPIPPGPPDVTLFPMKVEKKAVPEETDVVCVVSWQATPHLAQHYLLRKRPATGLLAGLWDFPVVPNVSSSTSFEEHARPLVRLAFPSVDDEGTLQIKNVTSIGSVLHVFSHVKKTFQVVCIQLCGAQNDDSDMPPQVTPGEWMDDLQQSTDVPKRPTKKQKTEKKPKDEDEDRLKWVLEANVGQENLGTGTMKVWSLVTSKGGASKKPRATRKPKAKLTDDDEDDE